MADWLNAPVGFVRVVLVLLGAFSTIPVAVYAGAALLIPARGNNRPSWDNLIGAGRVGLLFLVPAVVFGGSVDLTALFDEPPSLGIPMVALVLIGVAVLLSADYVRGRARTDAEARAVVLAAAPVACFAWCSPAPSCSSPTPAGSASCRQECSAAWLFWSRR